MASEFDSQPANIFTYSTPVAPAKFASQVSVMDAYRCSYLRKGQAIAELMMKNIARLLEPMWMRFRKAEEFP